MLEATVTPERRGHGCSNRPATQRFKTLLALRSAKTMPHFPLKRAMNARPQRPKAVRLYAGEPILDARQADLRDRVRDHPPGC